MSGGTAGKALLIMGLIGSLISIIGYVCSLFRPKNPAVRAIARFGYALAAAGAAGTFATLAWLVYHHQYQYLYVWEHSGNELHGWFRFAATWSAQEGSFLLWATWASIIGFLVMARAGKYEARVMPFYVSVLGFLCAILLRQSPFGLIPAPSAAALAANPDWHFPPLNGQGLSPSLVNYWMTIHPPTIFFGFASLAVPFCYAIAALIWKDYEDWTPRVMPYALLSCATLGIGLFMGGYWAYETLGWHGFWAWDPVENSSFFPWLAVTALVHGLVVQKSRGGMARTNTFLGVLAFWLFLVGTFLTRSGALSGKDANGDMLSVHAFDDIGKSAYWLMVVMIVVYGGFGWLMWLIRLRSMPTRKTVGDTLLSRDFAFFLAVTLMLVSCAIVTLGTTTPLFQGWMHKPVSPPKPTWYNHIMLPIAVMTALLLGCVPWLAWSKTNPEAFRKRLTIPWVAMLAFGFFMVFWVGSAQRALFSVLDPTTTEYHETMHAWVNPAVQRISVVALASVACLAALSNAMLAYKVFRKKPLNAGGWIAHVGIGLLMIGVIVSNTYERTARITLEEGQGSQSAFGYQFQFERMTGKPLPARPINPDYDRSNAIELRVTPPDADSAAPSDGGARTYLADLPWFVHNIDTTDNEDKFERMRWPSISKSLGHDLYMGLADDPGFELPTITLSPKERRDVGPYRIGYFDSIAIPMRRFQATLAILPPGGKPIVANPAQVFVPDPNNPSNPMGMRTVNENVAVPELADENGVPGAIYLQKIQPGTRQATFLLNLPDYRGHWEVPLEVTYKPWINLVWLGVLIATFGTLLAMVRRIIEQRRNPGGTDDEEFLDLSAPTPKDVTPVGGAQIVTAERKKRRLAT